MANFFTSPGDLTDWIRKEAKTEQDAAELVVSLPGVGTKDIDSIRESIRRIYSNTDPENSASVLFRILASAGITEEVAKKAAFGLGQVKAAEYLHQNKIITAEQKTAMIKEAQIMRQPGEYPMPLRYCPKLLGSVGKRLISTYNCRHYCLDGLVFDDDPERVYCGETLWRRHVMDKFSTEWKDRETGQYVGGYINGRFYVYHDVEANQMELKPNERTRKPRPHQWSVERRLVEQREKGSGQDLTLGKTASVAEKVLSQADGFTVLASANDAVDNSESFDKMANVFSDAISMKIAGQKDEDAAIAMSKKHSMPICKIVSIQSQAIEKMEKHQADAYLMSKTSGIDEDAVASGLVEAPTCSKCGKAGTLSEDRKSWKCEACKADIKTRQ